MIPLDRNRQSGDNSVMEEIHHLLGKEFFIPGNIPLRVLRRDPQPPYPLHTHDFLEMVVVLSGEGIHSSPHGDIPIEKGAVFVIKGDMIHGYRELRQLRLINILFDIQHLSIPLSDLGRSPGFHSFFTVDPHTRFNDLSRLMFTLNEHKLEELEKKIRQLEIPLESSAPGSQFLAISSFMQIMHFISLEFDRQHEGNPGAVPYRLGRALSHIENHLSENISIEELTDIAGMSESSLLRAFKKITGYSPNQYHQQLRVKRACWYLKHSQYSMMEISELLGYNDSNYFTRQFHKIQGSSPREYRKGGIYDS